MTSRTNEVAIIGGGISGLATAYFLRRESIRRRLNTRITLLEKSGRLGGVIRTERSDDCLLEWGPEGFAANKPWVEELAGELGLADQLTGSRDQDHESRTYVRRGGVLHPLPQGMIFLSPVRLGAFWKTAPLTTAGKLRALCEPLIPRSRKDLSVRQFLTRRLGEEFTRIVAEPLISAIYGTDPGELSIRSSMPDLYRMEQKYGSLWNGLRRFASPSGQSSLLLTFRDGMETLVRGLEEKLSPEAMIERNSGELSLQWNGNRVQIEGRRWRGEFDQIIFCSPAAATAHLLRPLLPQVSAALDQIPYSSSRLVYLAYPRREFSHPLNGFGFVVPPQDPMRIDACTWVSSKFHYRCPPDKVLIRCAIHNSNGTETPEETPLAEVVHEELKKSLGIRCRPEFARSRRVQGGMPRMLVGHERLLEEISRALSKKPQFLLAGAYSGGVGVPDRIRCARRAAEEACKRLIRTEESRAHRCR